MIVKTRRAALKLLSVAALAACAAEIDNDDQVAASTTPPETEGPFFPENTEVERDADLTRLE
ncbi:MAG: hypothetical protein ABL897_01835, partial [Hyphomicrobium sp.]